jgi:hypothetical protein
MGVFTYASDPSVLTSVQLADGMSGYAGKIEDERASMPTPAPTKSPNGGAEYMADESEMVASEDYAGLASPDMAMMGPLALNRLSTDEQYYHSSVPMNPMVDTVQDGTVGLHLDNMMGQPQQQQQVVQQPQQAQAPQHAEQVMSYQDMAPIAMPAMQQNNSPEVDTMPAQVSPTNNSMMYSDMMMQQALQQQQQGQVMAQYGGQQIQYVPVPTPVPVQMMPQMQMVPQMVPVPMPMNFQQVQGMPGQMPMQYYMVPQGLEQQQQQQLQQGDGAEAAKSGNFLEALMPKGWRKRQRPSKRPASRVQKVPSGRKIFVGGLSPNSTAESLIKHFCEFGKISDASVIHEAVSRKSRGFGYVEFAEKIPDGLLEMEHFIDQRRCGVRGYNYDPAEDFFRMWLTFN